MFQSVRYRVWRGASAGFEPTPPKRLGLKSNAFLVRRERRQTNSATDVGRRASHTLVNAKQLRRDSNPQPPDSKSDTLSIAPRSCFLCVWRSRGLNPGLSACKADALPLSYTPSRKY